MKRKRWLICFVFLFALSGILSAQDFSITIDAQKDAWYDGLTGPDDGYIGLPSRAYTADGGGAPDPAKGDDDISALVWMSWDETYLYVYGEITDDAIVVGGSASWANDNIELKLDPDPTKVNNGGAVGVRMTAFGEDNAQCDAGLVCWDDINTAQEMDSVVAVTSDDFARLETDNGYAVEFRVAWDNIKKNDNTVNVGTGNTVGMLVNITDNDLAGRETQLQWSAGFAEAAWNDVTQFGTVTLLADHKLQFVATNSSANVLQPCIFAENDSADVWYTPTPGSGTTGAFSIAIDAERDTWYDGLLGPEEGYVFIPPAAFDPGIDASSVPSDNSDLSAFFWTAWDTTYFYVYGEISDDVLAVTSTTGSWENDGIEVRMDANPNIADASPGSPGSLAGVSMTVFGEGDPRATGATNSMGGWTVTEADYARQDFAGGYSIEFRLPWAQVNTEGRTVNVEVDSIFGLALAVLDNDDVSRTDEILWSAVVSDETWRDSKKLGTAKLLADHKIQLTAVNSAQCPPPAFVTNDSADVWYNPDLLTSVELIDNGLVPETFGLEQNFPNPFNPETLIQFRLKTAENVTLEVYNVRGQLIRKLIDNEQFRSGTYETVWDGRNDRGELASSGVYFYKLKTKSFVETRKMALIK